MYFDDLTPYIYAGDGPVASVLNVGWLGAEHPFPVAPPDSELVSALRELTARPINLYRGKHQCEFCPAPPPEERNGLLLSTAPEEILGNGEIRVEGFKGITYVAPVLVRHYVEAHQYAPPPGFVEACIASANRADA